MDYKTITKIAIIAGAILFSVSLTADLIGLGSYPGINWAQLTGAAMGLVVILIGLWLRRFKVKQR